LKVKNEPYLGILLSYNSKPFDKNTPDLIKINPVKVNSDKIKISFYGAGNYATATLIPLMKDNGKVSFNGLVTSTGMSAQSVAKKFNFNYCASNFKEILNDENDVIAITSRHDTHSKAVCDALNANKNVYVEKPLAMSVPELQDIHQAYTDNAKSQIMVGFNRRFAPATNEII
jgi:polar amino acid transport system substrate-binding protein